METLEEKPIPASVSRLHSLASGPASHRLCSFSCATFPSLPLARLPPADEDS